MALFYDALLGWKSCSLIDGRYDLVCSLHPFSSYSKHVLRDLVNRDWSSGNYKEHCSEKVREYGIMKDTWANCGRFSMFSEN